MAIIVLLQSVQGFDSAMVQGCMQTLLDVATHTFDSKHGRQLFPTTRKPPKKLFSSSSVPVEYIEEATKSAITKFDSLEVYFAKGKQPEILKLLIEEVMKDFPQALGNKQMEEDITARFVGVRKRQKTMKCSHLCFPT